MPFRPAERVREPAVAMQPVIDPAVWYADDLAADDDWIYELSATEVDEIRRAVAGIERRGQDILDIRAEDFPLPRLDEALGAIYDELHEGRGFVLIRGMPVAEFTKVQAGIAFWGLGTRFGRPLSQNPKGHMLGHVKDFGGDYADPDVGTLRIRTMPNFWNHSSCDHSVSTRLLPDGPHRTRVQVTWLVDGAAEQRRDNRLEELMPSWQLTSEQDWAICENVQRGVAARHDSPGSLSPAREYNVDALLDWYLDQLTSGETNPG